MEVGNYYPHGSCVEKLPILQIILLRTLLRSEKLVKSEAVLFYFSSPVKFIL